MELGPIRSDIHRIAFIGNCPGGDTLHVYYGAADSTIGLATSSVRVLKWAGAAQSAAS